MLNIALELETYEPRVGTTGPFIRLHGTQRNGKPIRITFFGDEALDLGRQLGKIIPFGSTIAGMRLHVDVQGEWRDGKKWVDEKGAERQNRYFRGEKFEIPQGRALELERVRTDAAALMRDIDPERLTGPDLVAAFRKLAAFVSRTGGVTVDLSAMDDLDVEHEAAAHAPSQAQNTAALTPEEQAAQQYEREDRKNGLTAALEEAPAIEDVATVDVAAEVDAAAEVHTPASAEDDIAVDDAVNPTAESVATAETLDVAADQQFVASPTDEVSESIAQDLGASSVDPLAVDNDVDFSNEDDDSATQDLTGEPMEELEVAQPVENAAAPAVQQAAPGRSLPGRPLSAPVIPTPRPAAPTVAPGPQAPAAPAQSTGRPAPSAPVAARPQVPPMARPMPRPPVARGPGR
jgi:hypothetical protein